MTNLEKIEQAFIDEFVKWLFNFGENKNMDPAWCIGRRCEDVKGDCIICFDRWLNDEMEILKRR